MAVLDINQDNFQETVLQSDEPVLVDFTATWCGPCKLMAPIVDEVAEAFAGQAVIGKLDIDQNGPLAAQYGVMAVPTLVFFKGGEVVDRQVGLARKEDLVAKLKEILAAG